MANKENSIDFKLLRKKALGKIEPMDEYVVDRWLKESKANQEYFEKLQHYVIHGSVKSNKRIDPEMAWLNVSKRIQFKKAKSHHLLRVVSIAASFVLLSSLFYLYHQGMYPGKSATIADIEAGTSGAILKLSDGKVVDLGLQQELMMSEKNGATINASSKLLSYQDENVTSQDSVFNQLIVGKAKEFQIVLGDGTKVWLNSLSNIRYPVNFSGKTREVYTEGEVYFDVAENKDKPFIVHLPNNHSITVLGTEFNVNTHEDIKGFHTVLVEGSVKYHAGNDKEYMLTPGELLVDVSEDNSIITREVDLYPYTAWKDGRIVFENATIEHILNVLSRWYDIEVEYRDSNLKKIPFSLDVKRYEHLNKLLDMLALTGELNFETEGNKIVVTKPNK